VLRFISVYRRLSAFIGGQALSVLVGNQLGRSSRVADNQVTPGD
jgi:hypothetical protein